MSRPSSTLKTGRRPVNPRSRSTHDHGAIFYEYFVGGPFEIIDAPTIRDWKHPAFDVDVALG